MASKFGYRLTKRAESDLDGIVSYITVKLANPQASELYWENKSFSWKWFSYR